MCPAEKQIMQLQAREAYASAVHVISADPFLNRSNTCGIPRTRNLKICTSLIHAHRATVHMFYKLNELLYVLQKKDEHRALSNADTKYDALTHI